MQRIKGEKDLLFEKLIGDTKSLGRGSRQWKQHMQRIKGEKDLLLEKLLGGWCKQR